MRNLLGGIFLLLATGCGSPSTSTLSSEPAAPRTVEFRIPAGTGSAAWNTRELAVAVNVGDTLHIVNDDTVHHRLHTDGKPCPHGPEVLPGAAFDCVISRTFDPATDGSLYDHYVGSRAAFWVKAIAAP